MPPTRGQTQHCSVLRATYHKTSEQRRKVIRMRLLRTARRGSQVPVRMLLVVRHGIQPRVRQQAVTVVDTVTRRTGRSKSEAAGRRGTHAALKTRGQSRVRQEVLQRSRAATRSIHVQSPILFIGVNLADTELLELPQRNPLVILVTPLGITLAQGGPCRSKATHSILIAESSPELAHW